MRGLLDFVIEDSAQIRGFDANVVIQVNDHRGMPAVPNLLGNYDFSFNGSWFNTTVDPESDLIETSVLLNASLLAGGRIGHRKNRPAQ